MSTAAARRYTVEEYLALERDSDTKHEFYDGEIFELHRDVDPRAMAGATLAHNLIALNVAAELRSRLLGGLCVAFPSDLRVLCPTGLRTYPDAGVFCGTPEIEKIAGSETLKNPTLIVEVLSPSTELYDRGRKFRNYATIPSLKGYLLVSQAHPCVEHFARREDDRWLLTTADGLDATVELPELGLSIPVSALYAGVVLTPEEFHTHPGPPKSPEPGR